MKRKYVKDDDYEDAQFILENSDLLLKEDCMIVNNVLFERLVDDKSDLNFTCDYRYFITTDDYDYVEDDDEMTQALEVIFARTN